MACGREVFAEEDGAPVAEPSQVAELMSGVGLSNRVGTGEKLVPGEVGGRVRAGEGRGVKPEELCQRRVEDNESRLGDGRGVHPEVECFRQARVGIVEVPLSAERSRF